MHDRIQDLLFAIRIGVCNRAKTLPEVKKGGMLVILCPQCVAADILCGNIGANDYTYSFKFDQTAKSPGRLKRSTHKLAYYIHFSTDDPKSPPDPYPLMSIHIIVSGTDPEEVKKSAQAATKPIKDWCKYGIPIAGKAHKLTLTDL